MKRTLIKVEKIHPIFWKSCINCKQEFKKEFGWKVSSVYHLDLRFSTYYICNSCAKNETEAEKFIRADMDKYKAFIK